MEASNVGGKSVDEKVSRLCRVGEPAEIIKTLVLDSPAHLRDAFRDLKYGYFPIPSSGDEEERLIDRILWKLGFPLSRLPDYQRRFWNRLTQFRHAADAYRPAGGESARQEVRSESVNLFVSVEQLLDYTLSFATWALLYDHYMAEHSEQFVYNSRIARSYMASTLNGRGGVPRGDGEVVYFDPDGRNTLDPLIKGLDLLADTCAEVVRERETACRRSPDQLPWFASGDELEPFPFTHTVPVLDLDPASTDEILGILRRCAGALLAGNVSSIRNRIDHQREDFPLRTEMLSLAETLSSVFEELDVTGLMPTAFRHAGTVSDQYHRTEQSFVDYRGREVSLPLPGEFRRSRLPVGGTIQVICRVARLPHSSDVLRFSYEEASNFAGNRRGLPIRITASKSLPTIYANADVVEDEKEIGGSSAGPGEVRSPGPRPFS